MDAASAQDSTRTYQIAEQSLGQALREFALASNLDLLFSPDLVAGKKGMSLDGRFTIEEGLRTLLRGSGLEFSVSGSRVVISEAKPVTSRQATSSAPQGTNGYTQLAQADNRSVSNAVTQEAKSERVELEEITVVPEILVVGSRILNMDIRRTRDDPQPYVVLDRDAIESSGAANVEEFLKNRLTMNSAAVSALQQGPSGALSGGSSSRINLRGLGANQTLILIDGHRAASSNVQGSPGQPDLNGIPLEAIERIEVLPATASGIYGGSATGGVVNIVLRRDYSGVEARVTYDNSFESDSSITTTDLSAGFNFNEGATNVMVAGSHSQSNPLLISEREFIERNRQSMMANNPSSVFDGRVPLVGATPNVRSADGSPLVLDDGTPLNSPITFIPPGYPGSSSDGGHALVPNAGRYNLDPPNNRLAGVGVLYPLLSPVEAKSGTMTLRHEFTPRVRAFLDAGASNSTEEFSYVSNILPLLGIAVPASAPNNPFRQNVIVSVPGATPTDSFSGFSETSAQRLVGGVILKLPGDWLAEVDYTWSRASIDWASAVSPSPAQRTAFATAAANGTFDVLQDSQPLDFSPYLGPTGYSLSPWRTTLKDAVVRFAGPIGSSWAGAMTLSGMLEHREEVLGEAIRVNFNAGVDRITPEQSQSVNSAYLEARIPLVSAANNLVGVRDLDLQLAGRRDEYTTEGALAYLSNSTSIPAQRTNEVGSTDFTVGLRYAPIQDVMFRASYGTGFLPPAVDQLVPGAPFTTPAGGLTDPRRGNELLGPWQNTTGGNPDLQPESSKSWSYGAIFVPRFVPGLRLSIDYTRVEKSENITTFPGGVQAIINSESVLPGRVTRAPASPNDPFGVGPIIAIDQTLFNIAQAEIQAYDVQLDQHLETMSAGSFDFYALATWQTHYETRALAGEPVLENVGVSSSNPLELKANAGLIWNYQRWRVGWSARYFDSYVVANPNQTSNATIIMNQGNGGRIPSQTYHDFFARYSFGPDATWRFLADTELRIGVRNVFNEEPPLDVGATASVRYSPYGDPRLRTYSVSLKKSF